jgi:hypothetical protein
MAIKLENKPNVLAPNGTYTYGNIQDESTPGANDGTPINEEVYADFHQFFARLAGPWITYNGLPDNTTNGYQFMEALWRNLHFFVSQDIMKGILGNYTTGDLIILHGCVITPTIPGSSSITAGAIYYNGNIYQVAANANVVTAGAETLVFKIQPIAGLLMPTIYLDGDASGSGIADYNASTVKRIGSNFNNLSTKIVDIGDWDMDATDSITVAHGCDNLQIRNIEAVIFTDTGVTVSNGNSFPLGLRWEASGNVQGGLYWGATDVYLHRLIGGLFDSTSFNATSYNRGHLIITYQSEA